MAFMHASSHSRPAKLRPTVGMKAFFESDGTGPREEEWAREPLTLQEARSGGCPSSERLMMPSNRRLKSLSD